MHRLFNKSPSGYASTAKPGFDIFTASFHPPEHLHWCEFYDHFIDCKDVCWSAAHYLNGRSLNPGNSSTGARSIWTPSVATLGDFNPDGVRCWSIPSAMQVSMALLIRQQDADPRECAPQIRFHYHIVLNVLPTSLIESQLLLHSRYRTVITLMTCEMWGLQIFTDR